MIIARPIYMEISSISGQYCTSNASVQHQCRQDTNNLWLEQWMEGQQVWHPCRWRIVPPWPTPPTLDTHFLSHFPLAGGCGAIQTSCNRKIFFPDCCWTHQQGPGPKHWTSLMSLYVTETPELSVANNGHMVYTSNLIAHISQPFSLVPKYCTILFSSAHNIFVLYFVGSFLCFYVYAWT